MPKYKIAFTRTIREYHETTLIAADETTVEQAYESGELQTAITETKIVDEDGPYIHEIAID